MNDRGLELSAADLIKNYLFGRAEADLERVKYNWFRMVGTLDTITESDVVKEYVRHFWISRNGVVRSQQLFDAIKRRVRASRADAVNLVQDLSDTATNYVALATPSHSLWNEYGEDARRAVDTLNTLGVVQVRPLLLAAIEHFDKKEVVQILKRAVSWSVRLLIAGTQGSGALETIYGDTAAGIYTKRLISANEVSAQMEKAVPKDDKFEQDFFEAHASKEKLARYYLRAMQRRQQNEQEPYFKPNDELGITLDHIMPETLSDEWKHITPEIHGDYLTRIGNLALLQKSVNSTLRSAGFQKKKAYLAEAGFSLTSDVAKHADWGKDEIETRQKSLAGLAVETWPLRPK